MQWHGLVVSCGFQMVIMVVVKVFGSSDVVLQLLGEVCCELTIGLDEVGRDGNKARPRRGRSVDTAVIARKLHRGARREPMGGDDGGRDVEGGGEVGDGGVDGGGDVGEGGGEGAVHDLGVEGGGVGGGMRGGVELQADVEGGATGAWRDVGRWGWRREGVVADGIWVESSRASHLEDLGGRGGVCAFECGKERRRIREGQVEGESCEEGGRGGLINDGSASRRNEQRRISNTAIPLVQSSQRRPNWQPSEQASRKKRQAGAKKRTVQKRQVCHASECTCAHHIRAAAQKRPPRRHTSCGFSAQTHICDAHCARPLGTKRRVHAHTAHIAFRSLMTTQ